MKSAYTTAAIVAVIAFVEMFLMLRSSLLSRVKEVGILRAIGLKKRDIYRMFSGEIIDITLITAVPGIALIYYILHIATDVSESAGKIFMLNPMVALATFAVVLIFNLFSGLLPVFKILRRTPAQILARTDI